MDPTTTTPVPPRDETSSQKVQAAPAEPTIPNSSRELGALFAALAKAQGEIQAAERSATGRVGKEDSGRTFTYADLGAIWDACRPALSSVGLAVIQRARVSPGGPQVAIETILGHESGQWMRAELTLLSCDSNGNADSRPRSVGSAISYGRRYGLAAMVGVVPAEDEQPAAAPARGGQQGAQARQQPQRQAQRQQQAAKPAPAAAKPAPKTQPEAAPDPIYNPETGELLDADAAFERLQIVLGECSSTVDLEKWKHWKDGVSVAHGLSDGQLAILKKAFTAKWTTATTTAA